MVRPLLARGANPNLAALDENGKETAATALTFAKIKHNEEIIFILEQSAKARQRLFKTDPQGFG